MMRVRATVVHGFPMLAALSAAAVLAFRGGGYTLGRTAPVVLAYLVAVAVWFALARPRLPRLSLTWVAAGGLAAFALWSGTSVAWSVGPDLSWVSFDVALLYTVVAVTVLLARPTVGDLRLVTSGVLCLGVAIAVYALLGKVVPDVVSHAHQYARLSQPLGYWNVLALMLVAAVPVALAVAARGTVPAPLRALVASALALLLITLFFTFSRGGFLALVLALVVFFAATRERLAAAISLAIASIPSLAALIHLRGLSTVFGPTDDAAVRTAEGHRLGQWVLVALALAFAAQMTLALLQRRLRPRPRLTRVVGWALLVCVVLAVVGGPLAYMSRHGGVRDWVATRIETFTNPSGGGGDTAGRLLVANSNGRIQLYRIALRGTAVHPLTGTGAGTFVFTNYRFRDGAMVVKHAHSQWMEVLASLGAVGLALLAVAMLALVVAMAVAVVRAWRHPERGLLAAALAAVLGALAHLSIDWDWDMTAMGVVCLLLAFTLAGLRDQPRSGAGVCESSPTAGEPAAADPRDEHTGDSRPGDRRDAPLRVERRRRTGLERRLSLPMALLGSGLLLLGAVSWLLPYLSDAAQRRAVAEAEESPERAARHARRAQRLNPLAVDPLLTLSQIELRLGRPQAAHASLLQAVRLQPQNYRVHYRLGMLLATVYHRFDEAAVQFRWALALNPGHRESAYQLGLLEPR